MRRLVAAILAIVVVAAALGWAVGRLLVDRDEPAPAEPAPRPEAAPDPGSRRAPDPALAPFYRQRPEWRGCGGNECATLRVPLDYDDPGGRAIELALLRVPAGGDRIGALVVNPGGPGAPGTDYAAAGERVFREPLLQRYDVVGFDPRGTGDSSPVDCLSDAELDAYLAGDPDPDDPAEAGSLVAQLREFGRGCVADDAELAAHVTTVEAALDLDVLRAALGQRRLDYLGASYGTRLGATYAELFPDRVGRFVLDGALDVSLSSRRLSLGQARGFETALRAYVQDCVDTADPCFLGGTVDEGIGRITGFLADVDADPLPTGTDRQLTVGNAFYGLVLPLYVRDYWPVLTQALQAGFEGDGGLLLRLADLYASRGPDGYTDNSAEAFLAINCLDDPFAIAADDVPGQLPAFRRASPTFGDVFAWGMVGCIGQVAEATVRSPRIDGSGAPPIVVVGTTRDPATPYEWAEALADDLDSGVLVTREGDGHTGYNTGNSCVDGAVEAFLLRGEIPRDGLTC